MLPRHRHQAAATRPSSSSRVWQCVLRGSAAFLTLLLVSACDDQPRGATANAAANTAVRLRAVDAPGPNLMTTMLGG